MESADSSDSIRGTIEPVKTSIGYRLAVIPVTILMVILPLVYLAVIFAAGAFTVWYSINGLSVFENTGSSGRRAGQGALMLYLGPLIGSALTVLFLIKPLFFRIAVSKNEVELSQDQEPKLFDFVRRIAKAVHAPPPTRISVDNDVNASASFRRGWLSMFSSGDLELRIGLPLVERLTAEELAGVIAHEFGHFSQGLGMRLSYIIRSINFWFARVVYQRDAADQWLASWAKRVDFRIAILLYFAMALIWISRRLLWLLMMIGNACSSLLMRQMEFDADQHEIRLAGSDRFITTAHKLPRLGVAYREATIHLQNSFVDGRLADNLPGLVGQCFDQQTSEIQQKLAEHRLNEKASWFDTHPLDRERISKAQQAATNGILKLSCPSQELFRNYDSLAKESTRRFYEQAFQGEFKESMLTSLEQVQKLAEGEKEASDARNAVLGEEFSIVRSLPLVSPENRFLSTVEASRRVLSCRQLMESKQAEFRQLCKGLADAENRWLAANQALTLHIAGVKFPEKVWEKIPVHSEEATKAACDEVQQELSVLHQRMMAFEQLFSERVDAALQYLWSLADNDSFVASSERNRAIKAITTLINQSSCVSSFIAMKKEFGIVLNLFATANFGELSTPLRKQVEIHIEPLKTAASNTFQSLKNTPYPFEHAQGEIELVQYLVPSGLNLSAMDKTFETAGSMLQNFSMVYFRSIGVLCSVVRKVESHIADRVPAESTITTNCNDTSASFNDASGPPSINELGSSSTNGNTIHSAGSRIEGLEPVSQVLTPSSRNPTQVEPSESDSEERKGLDLSSSPPKTASRQRGFSRGWVASFVVLGTGVLALMGILAGFFVVYLTKANTSSEGKRDKVKSIYLQPPSIRDDLRYGVNQPLSYHWQVEFPVAYDFTIAPAEDKTNPTHRFRIWYLSAQEASEGEKATNSISTGWAIGPGLVVTLASNVFGAKGIWIHDGNQTSPAEIVAVDREKNLALLLTGKSNRSTLAIKQVSPDLMESQLKLLSVHAAADGSQSTRTVPIQVRSGTLLKTPKQYGDATLTFETMAASEPDRGAPIVDNSGRTIGLADVRPVIHSGTDGEYSISLQTSIVPIQDINQMLRTYNISIDSSPGVPFKADSTAQSGTQPVVKIQAKNVDPIKKISYRLDIQKASTGTIQSATGISGTLYATSSGKIMLPQNIELSVPAVGSYPAMVLFPLDTCRSHNWVQFEQQEFPASKSNRGFGAGVQSKSVPYKTLSLSNAAADYNGENLVKVTSTTKRAITFANGQSNLLEVVSSCEFDSMLGLPRAIEHRITQIKDQKPGKTFIVEGRMLDSAPPFDATTQSVTSSIGGRTNNKANSEKK